MAERMTVEQALERIRTDTILARTVQTLTLLDGIRERSPELADGVERLIEQYGADKAAKIIRALLEELRAAGGER